MQTTDQFQFFKVKIWILKETPHIFTKHNLPFQQVTEMHRYFSQLNSSEVFTLSPSFSADSKHIMHFTR